MTQNKSPLDIATATLKNSNIIGVIKEGYIELVTVEPMKRTLFCCCLKKHKHEPQIVEAQLFAEKNNSIEINEKEERSYKLKFHSLKRGFKRTLELELDFNKHKFSITPPSKERS